MGELCIICDQIHCNQRQPISRQGKMTMIKTFRKEAKRLQFSLLLFVGNTTNDEEILCPNVFVSRSM